VSKPERRSLRLLTVLVAIAIVTVVSLFGVSAGHTVLSAVLITVLVGVVASSPIALVAWVLADDRNAARAEAPS
jgi:preprotein translocase subunit SecF